MPFYVVIHRSYKFLKTDHFWPVLYDMQYKLTKSAMCTYLTDKYTQQIQDPRPEDSISRNCTTETRVMAFTFMCIDIIMLVCGIILIMVYRA